ncbi:hypothetical protein [Streptomyces hoynatensis]|uniref:DUF4149 domain-containing protein n=1 Tax=Streptomyces hoynatensis TaxID=1141874 RepID=A0A3A9YKL1_9ACTN|nr:hypothetical protein [Streptomyces hoynatensis]RKN37011.1 hypothetical protein D7294_29265 [Streptomyces hoynatensis]
MNTASAAVAAALAFVWLGMVLGISFLETPLKFRAPGVTLPLGLGIGRVVFRALNAVESVLAVVLVVVVATAGPGVWAVVPTALAAVLLAGQLAVVRPRLNRRSDLVLSGAEPGRQRSRAHLYYVALELAKVGALTALGCVALAQ